MRTICAWRVHGLTYTICAWRTCGLTTTGSWLSLLSVFPVRLVRDVIPPKPHTLFNFLAFTRGFIYNGHTHTHTHTYIYTHTHTLAKGKPTASAEGSLAVRRGGGAGEYLNGENLPSLSLYLKG